MEYFVSYYDYYQPEAYVPSSDTYIAKDSSINDEIDKLRLSATACSCPRERMLSWWRVYPVFTVWVAPDGLSGHDGVPASGNGVRTGIRLLKN